MKFDQLNYFLAVARYEHVGKAARSLHLSPSAVSHSLRALEQDLGCKLVEQQGRRIFLTEAGKALQIKAEALLAEAERIRQEMSAGPLRLTGHLRVAASHVLSSRLLLPPIAELQSQHPKLTCEILTLRSAAVVESVLLGDVDVGICFSAQDHPSLGKATVYQGEMYPAVGVKHPLLKRRGSVVKELSEYPAVLPKSFRGIEVCEKHPMFEKFSLSFQPKFLYDNYDIAIELMKRSTSWSLLPDVIVKLHEKDLKSLPVPPGWKAPFEINAVWLRDRAQNRAAKMAIDAVSDYLGRLS